MNMMSAELWEKADSLSADAILGLAMQIIDTPRPMPPAWMIAPNFRGAETIAVREPQAAYAAASQTAPYRSVREVPRLS